MRFIVGEKIRVEEPTKDFIFWAKDALTMSNPEYEKKKRMGFWTGKTPKQITLYEVDGADYIVPYGCIGTLSEVFKGTPILGTFPNTEYCYYGGEEVPLFDYQKTAVRKMINAGYGILQSAPGSGKTQMGIAIAKQECGRCLWLTHTADLLNQSKARAEMYIDKEVIGTITAGKVKIGSAITFATIQTMCKLDLEQYKDQWSTIIVDECHKAVGTPTAVSMFSKVLNGLRAKHKYGLSATVHRADGLIRCTFALLGDVGYIVPDEAVRDRTMQIGIKPVETRTQLDYDSCLNTDGTLNYTGMITYLTEALLRNITIVSSIEEGRPGLILSSRVKHLETLMGMLKPEMRKDAVLINGKMTTKKGKAEREQALEDMRTGKKKYLFATYQLAKEGLDIPCLERLYLVTPEKDYTTIRQSIGRIERVCDGKDDPVVYDFVDDIDFLRRMYKKRLTTYKKANCYLWEDAS